MPEKLVVVTGGAGFLGSHLVAALAATHRVRVVDAIAPPGWIATLGADYLRADVADANQLLRAVDGAAVVVHAAFAPPSASPQRLEAVNVGGTRNVLRAAAATAASQVVVVSSTIVTAAPRRHPVLRSAPLNRLDAYRATRARAEEEALGGRGGPVPVAVVRPKTFIGPGRVGGFALVFDLVRRGGHVPIAGRGTNRYQLLDVRDLVDALVALTTRQGAGVYELGTTSFGTIAADLEALIDAAGTGARLRRLPRLVGRSVVRGVELAGLAPLAEWHHATAAGRDSVVDPSRAVAELGWTPTRSNVEALVDAYRWYAGEHHRGAPVRTTHEVPRSHRHLGRLARSMPRW